MRITQTLITNIVRQSADRAASALMKAQRPLLDGTSLPNASSDLTKADRAGLLDRFDEELARHDKSRSVVRSDLASAEAALSGMHDLVVDAQDLALQLGTDSAGSEGRIAGAAIARGLIAQLAALANRRDAGGKYQFTGLAEGQPPLTPDFQYQGNDGVRMVEVGPGVSVAATIAGRDVFGQNNELITTLQGLVTALESGDADAVRATLTGIGEVRERVAAAVADVGGRMASLDDLGDLTLSLRTSVQIEHETLTGVDVADVAPAVANAQTMLEAVLATSQRIMAQIGASWFQ